MPILWLKLDNILTSSTKPHSPYFQFFKKHPTYVKNLRTFGEMGVVTIHQNKTIRGKLDPCGKICMFVGYPNNTSADTFRMLSLDTNYIIKSRDILWLNETIGTYKQRMNNEVSEIIVPPSPVLETTAPGKVKTEPITQIPHAV